MDSDRLCACPGRPSVGPPEAGHCTGTDRFCDELGGILNDRADRRWPLLEFDCGGTFKLPVPRVRVGNGELKLEGSLGLP